MSRSRRRRRREHRSAEEDSAAGEESAEDATPREDDPAEEAAEGDAGPETDRPSRETLLQMAEMRGGIETALLGSEPTLTRLELAERTGVDPEVSAELWRLLGFARVADDEVAFTERDAEALTLNRDLMELGVIDSDSQAALVRTLGRSFARLAEWQTDLLARVALDSPDPADQLADMIDEVLPRVEKLQSYIWRRHLASTANRMLAAGIQGDPEVTAAVGFVDIVGYTTRSKNLDERDLVDWIERFEDESARAVIDAGGRVIKTIGDEILFVVDDPVAAAEVALALTERGQDPEERFPQVRAGLALGEVVHRLGDVYGPTVNIAARLTSVARPDHVLVDRAMHDALAAADEPEGTERSEGTESDGSTTPEATVTVAERMRELLSLPDVQRAVQEDTTEGVPEEDEEGHRRSRGTPLDVVEVSPDEPTAVLPVVTDEDREDDGETPERFRFKKLRRVSVKGYSRLETWSVRRARDGSSRKDGDGRAVERSAGTDPDDEAED